MFAIFLSIAVCIGGQGSRPGVVDIGVFYMPREAAELARMVEGNPGGKKAFSLALAPLVRGEKEDWEPYLKAAARHDSFRVVLDVHVCAGKEWTEGDRLRELLARVMSSPHASQVGGWLLTDEPFGRSRPERKNPTDVARIVDVLRIVREVDPKGTVFSDYAATAPLEERDGRRRRFLWNGEWVHEAKVPGGATITPRFGAFGEDIVLLNWWEDARSLKRWLPRITKEVKPSQIVPVVGWDWTPRSDRADAQYLERIKEIIAVADKAGVRGYWFWPWQDIPIPSQKRDYKGVAGFWEDGPKRSKTRRRYAHLVESLR